MILLRRLNGEEVLLNPHLIETIEATPDTVITLTNSKHLMVQEDIKTVVARIIKYRQEIGHLKFNETDEVS